MDRKTLPSMVVRIVLAEDTPSVEPSPKPQIRHCGDEIQGHLEVSCNSSFEFSVDISFEGLIRTWIGSRSDTDSFQLPPTAEFQFLEETQKAFSDPSTGGYNGHLWIYRVPFRFIVPDELISSQSNIHPDFLRLCPSAKQGLGYLGFAQPSIIYLLRIKRIKTGVPVATFLEPNHPRELIVMPYTPAAPPLAIEDFPQDYRLCIAKSLKQHRWGRSFGILKVASAEPSPLNTHTIAPRTTTSAVLKLVFASNSSCDLHAQPNEWNLVVKQHLQSRTFYSTRRLDRPPTLAIASADPYMRVRDEKTLSEVREYKGISWRRDAQPQTSGSTASSDVEEQCIWRATLDVPVHARKTLLPTFSNPLSAHQYVLVLQLSIKGLCHGAMKLVLPVQVFYCPPNDTRLGLYEEGGNGNLDEIALPVSRNQRRTTTPDAEAYSSLRADDTSPPPYDDL